uniref:RING-type E3 ubiquitin transferase n=1 Tax=Melopsittacus undulatus TaxID=13146 RepID=A0A8V5FUQ3_MELUD
MSCAGGSLVLPPAEPQRDPGAPLGLPAGAGEASGDTPEEGESGGPSTGEGRRGGSEAGAAGGDKPETRSVCSSESGSGSHPGGAGPICKICFQGPEQVSRAGQAGGLRADRPTPLTGARCSRKRQAAISTADRARRLQPGCPRAPGGQPPSRHVLLCCELWENSDCDGWLGELLNPCRCDGSVRYTHQLCLLKWISERGSWTCELCCYRYHVIAIKMKKPCQWQSITITLVEKVQMVAVILGSLFLVASVTWLLWSAFSPYAVWQRKDILFQICYGMYGFMDLVCIGLIVHEGASVYRVFKRWRAVNLHWDVLNYDKATDIEESNRGESSAGRTLWLPLTAFRNRSLVHPTQLTSPRFQCGYVLLHLFNRMRPQEDSSGDNGSGEVVMRVTSV